MKCFLLMLFWVYSERLLIEAKLWGGNPEEEGAERTGRRKRIRSLRTLCKKPGLSLPTPTPSLSSPPTGP